MEYGLEKIPFSRYGSYFAVSINQEDGCLYLRDLHGGDETCSDIYEMRFPEIGERQRFIRTESELMWFREGQAECWLKICMDRDGRVHFLADGLVLELHARGGRYDTLVPLDERRMEHHFYKKQRKFLFTCLQGRITQIQQWDVVGSRDAVISVCGKNAEGAPLRTHCVLESYRCVGTKQEYPSYEEAHKETKEAFDAWERQFRGPNRVFEESRRLAAYLTWANFVPANGFLTHDAMYMSKNWMFNIWSWDNCFGGIALSRVQPKLAWGQLKIFMDNQDSCGVYADYINEAGTSFNCTKPPIHAWAFQKMSAQNAFFLQKEIQEEAYESFCRVTDYWLCCRRTPGAVMPVYFHGNDSGWDNASVFHRGFPVESPDLSAFLIYQMDVLSRMAQELHRPEESATWKKKADEMYGRFFERFFINGRLCAWYTPERQQIMEGDSLLMYMPLQIAYRMEKKTADELVRQMLERFETPYGLATENPRSEYYKTGGYWLGPVWAPVMYLMIDALRDNGYEQEARRLAEKFCRVTQIGLMSENYDPFTGDGYDDPAFSWPSCVLLQLLWEYPDLGEE